MNTIRIGNDIDVVWKIFSRNGLKFSLENKIIKLWLLSGPFKKEITDFTVQLRNELKFFIDADDLQRVGVYKLQLSILDTDARTEDATFDLTEVFQIVSKVYEDTNNNVQDGNIVITVASVLNNIETSTLEGASAYEIAVKHGYEGTEEEWLASLKGETGPAGVVSAEVSVDGTHGTPTASASVSGGVLSVAFTGLKGEPGEDGVGFKSVKSDQDGTVKLTLTSDDIINIDLNHTHPAYYSKVAESAMPEGGFVPDVVYDLGTLTGTVTFTLAAAVQGNLNHYYWMFNTSSTAPSITWPTGIVWASGNAPTISASKHYEVSILDGIALSMEV